MVCLDARGPENAALLRYGSRMAGRLNRNWYAVYVQTLAEDPLRIDAARQRYLSETLTLAKPAWRDGVHLQGRRCRGYLPPLRPGISHRTRDHRQARSKTMVEENDREVRCGRAVVASGRKFQPHGDRHPGTVAQVRGESVKPVLSPTGKGVDSKSENELHNLVIPETIRGLGPTPSAGIRRCATW